jgi:hypothetical protein
LARQADFSGLTDEATAGIGDTFSKRRPAVSLDQWQSRERTGSGAAGTRKQKALTGKPNGESATALAGTGAAANANAAASDATKKSRRSCD